MEIYKKKPKKLIKELNKISKPEISQDQFIDLRKYVFLLERKFSKLLIELEQERSSNKRVINNLVNTVNRLDDELKRLKRVKF